MLLLINRLIILNKDGDDCASKDDKESNAGANNKYDYVGNNPVRIYDTAMLNVWL